MHRELLRVRAMDQSPRANPEDAGPLKRRSFCCEFTSADSTKFNDTTFAVVLDSKEAFELFVLTNIGDGIAIDESLNVVSPGDHAKMIPLPLLESSFLLG